MTLEERIKHLLAESEKEDITAEEQLDEVSNDTPSSSVSDQVSVDESYDSRIFEPEHKDKPVVAWGVKGMDSKKFSKKFKNKDHFDKWADSESSEDHEVHGLKLHEEAEDQSSMSDQVSALLEAEGLSEDFKLQAVTIFEAAVSDRVMQIEEELKEEYQEALDEATAEMEKHIDGFMSEAIQQWMIDNKLAVETNFKHKLQESFIDGLTALLAEHNIELPAESENALDVALDQITSLEESIESASVREAELMEQIAEMKATSILESFRSKMPATTFDRFVQLTENINYTDEAQYARQLDIVYENFGKVTAVVESVPARQITESIAQPAVAEDLNESVEFYAQYMSK